MILFSLPAVITETESPGSGIGPSRLYSVRVEKSPLFTKRCFMHECKVRYFLSY